MIDETPQPDGTLEPSGRNAATAPESRNRMISFRLSAEEYDRLRDLCFTNGIRNVSEMARTAINSMLQQPGHAPRQSLEARMTGLEDRFQLLAVEFKRLRRQFAPNQTAPDDLSLAATAGVDSPRIE